MGEGDVLEFESREDWQNWLKANWTSEREVWVLFYNRKCPKRTMSFAQAVEDALCYGWIDDVLEGMDQDSYAFRFVPISRDHEWSNSDKAKAFYLLKNGMMHRRVVDRMPAEVVERLTETD